jgi:Transmembrane secretion effector
MATETCAEPRISSTANLRWYLSSIAVSGTGSAVSGLAIPIMAVVSLGASAAQMSVLAAIGLIPSLLLQVVAGMWADSGSISRIRMMVVTDVMAGVLIGLVPILWAAGVLNFWLLIAVISAKAVVGVCQLAFSSPVVVELVARERLVAANGKVSSVRSVTDIAGQALGGALIAVFALPYTLLADAVSYFASAAMASRIRIMAASAAPAAGQPTDHFSIASMRGIARRLLGRSDLLSLTTIALIGGLNETLIVLFCVHTLHIDRSILGFLIASGAIGGVGGGLLAGRMVARFGSWSVLIGAIATIAAMLSLPFVEPGFLARVAIVFLELGAAFGGTIALAAMYGAIQSDAAEGTLARTMALTTNVLQVAALAGIVIGGVVGERTSPRIGLTLGLVLLVVMSVLVTVRKLRKPARSR